MEPKNNIYSHIPESTTVGKGTKIGRLCHIDRNVIIGDNCNIQGMVYVPPGIIIEDDVFIGPGTVFCNDKYPPNGPLLETVVKSGAVIGANCTIGPGLIIRGIIGQGSNVITGTQSGFTYVGNPAKLMIRSFG